MKRTTKDKVITWVTGVIGALLLLVICSCIDRLPPAAPSTRLTQPMA